MHNAQFLTTLTTKVPVTVISGFLGAGKTTIIKNLLKNPKSKRLALIINEFGDFGIDVNLLQGCGIAGNCADEDIIELNNGCICCTVADDFIPAMSKLLSPDRIKPDHIIIETSGLALPQPLITAFNWPEISTQAVVDGVITVVDALAVINGTFAENPWKVDIQRREDAALNHYSSIEDLFKDQIHAADLILLNKVDLLDKDSIIIARKRVVDHNIRAIPIILTYHGMLDPDILLGVGSIESKKSHDTVYYKNTGSHDHDSFCSFIVRTGEICEPQKFAKSLKRIVSDHGILRLKGFVAVINKPMRLVFQTVGPRIEYYFDRPWREQEERETCLVVIAMRTVNRTFVTSSILELV